MNSNYKFYPDKTTGCLSQEDAKKYFSRVGFSVFAMMLGIFLVSNFVLPFVSKGVTALFPQFAEYGWFLGILSNVLSVIAIYCGGVPLFFLVSKPLPKITPFKAKMSLGKFFGGVCVALLAMMVGNYISTSILTLFTILGAQTQNPLVEITAGVPLWITILFSCIIAPIFEELFFRKALCDRLLPLGEGYAIVISSVVFGLAHQNFYQFAYAFLLGMLFALIYVKTGKLKYSVIYHMIINILGMVIGPWLVEQVNLDAMLEALNSGSFDFDPGSLIFLFIMFAYSMLLMVLEIVGLVLLFKATKAKTIRLEAGILPPPKEHRVGNIFFTVGVAASVAYFAFAFVLSLLNF